MIITGFLSIFWWVICIRVQPNQYVGFNLDNGGSFYFFPQQKKRA